MIYKDMPWYWRAWRRVQFPFTQAGVYLWALRHPGVGRCPKCRLTWEVIEDGRCHNPKEGSDA